MGRDATRPQHARCTMQAIHDNTRRQDARSRRSSSNRRLTDASDSKSPSREREQSRCDSDGGALTARAVWQMPAQQSTQREARRERLPATRVDQESRRLLLARISGSSPPARRDLHAICHDVARSRGVSGSAINVCDARSATEARGAREHQQHQQHHDLANDPSRRAPPTPSAKQALARVRPPTACAHHMKGGARTRMHTCRARAPPSRRRPSSIRARSERGATHDLFWWREN